MDGTRMYLPYAPISSVHPRARAAILAAVQAPQAPTPAFNHTPSPPPPPPEIITNLVKPLQP